MWIAKNSITGKTYGKKFSSIYDCQNYIHEELKILEYEYQRVLAIEHQIDDECDFDVWCKSNQIDNSCFANIIIARFQFSIQRLVESPCPRSNNVIRCWYVEQARFADGFDF